jgi:hypothetical protein
MPRDVLGAASLQMLFGGLFMLAAGTALGEWDDLSFTPKTTFATRLPDAAGIGASRSRPTRMRCVISTFAIVSLYTYVNPVIAVALGTIPARRAVSRAHVDRRRDHSSPAL